MPLPKTMPFSSYQMRQKKSINRIKRNGRLEELETKLRESTHTFLKCSTESHNLGDFIINPSLGKEHLSQE